MSWLRESISDVDGLADVSYVAVLALIALVIAVTLFLCGMVLTAYLQGRAFDPLPIAQAFGLICAAFFTTGLGGLTAYMVATRRRNAIQPNAVRE